MRGAETPLNIARFSVKGCDAVLLQLVGGCRADTGQPFDHERKHGQVLFGPKGC